MYESIAGVDGCKDGWIAAFCPVINKPMPEFKIYDTFRELIERMPDSSLIMIDIPIGLADEDSRQCDIEARKKLDVRGSSVFPTPIRAVVEDPRSQMDYAYAVGVSQQNHKRQKGISKQTHAILPKIAKVNELMTPELQNRILETHPELIFWALNHGEPLPPKKTEKGKKRRIEILDKIFPGIEKEIYAKAKEFCKEAKIDDVIDACACLATAILFLTHKTTKIPTEPETDKKGLRMEMHYPNPDKLLLF